MSRRKLQQKERLPLLKETLHSPAWRALSHGARSLYVLLKERYNSKEHNNGRIFLSQREAAEELGSGTEEITRWFRELQHYGFIVQTAPGCLGLDGKGKAPHWRLTELGYMRDPPTRDFLRWNGTPFGRRKLKPRPGKPVTKWNKCPGKPGHTAAPPCPGKPGHS
jgi:hypothetical protein